MAKAPLSVQVQAEEVLWPGFKETEILSYSAFYSGLNQWVEDHHVLRKGNLLTPSHQCANLSQKYSYRPTQDDVWPSVWVLCGPVKLIHTSIPHSHLWPCFLKCCCDPHENRWVKSKFVQSYVPLLHGTNGKVSRGNVRVITKMTSLHQGLEDFNWVWGCLEFINSSRQVID